MLPTTFSRGFTDGLKEIKGKDRSEQNQNRVLELFNLLDCNRELGDETIKSLIGEVYQRYFQSNHGSFFMAQRFRTVMDENPETSTKIKPLLNTALIAFADLMCHNLGMANQIGRHDAQSQEVAFWLVQKVHCQDIAAAERLMRTCGKSLSGEEIDQFFWDLKSRVEDEADYNVEWALRVFSQGMADREGVVKVVAEHLVAKGRGPKPKDPTVFVEE